MNFLTHALPYVGLWLIYQDFGPRGPGIIGTGVGSLRQRSVAEGQDLPERSHIIKCGSQRTHSRQILSTGATVAKSKW